MHDGLVRDGSFSEDDRGTGGERGHGGQARSAPDRDSSATVALERWTTQSMEPVMIWAEVPRWIGIWSMISMERIRGESEVMLLTLPWVRETYSGW